MLNNLRDLFNETKRNIAHELLEITEYEFSEEFIQAFKDQTSTNIQFFRSTAIIPTSTKSIIAPSMWFIIGCHLTDLLEELENYKNRVLEIIEGTQIINIERDFENWADELRRGTRELEQAFIDFSNHHYSNEDTDKIRTFLTDYSSWGGGKSIGRSQNDFAHSVLLKASGLLNESSGYVSAITHTLLHNPNLKAILLRDTRRIDSVVQTAFSIEKLFSDFSNSGLKYSDGLLTRYVSSLSAKPFLLLSGLSGSGKTKLAQSFAHWLCTDETQYCIVPVGADWTNREPLLGYVNALDTTEYVVPENGALELILRANENSRKPHFLILDEMNLSHVERYFADFLSVMESGDNFKLHSDKANKKSGVPYEVGWPNNLFIIGTVNIDETTYMFSPKVLDRANVIEFRIGKSEIQNFLEHSSEITSVQSMGASMEASFVSITQNRSNSDYKTLNLELLDFFGELQALGAEFGYRTASEIKVLFSKIDLINPEYTNKVDEKIDIAIMQKLLPKLHGSRRKILKALNLLAQKCLTENQEVIFDERGAYQIDESNSIKYQLSFEKIARMYKSAIDNGFSSYAEA